MSDAPPPARAGASQPLAERDIVDLRATADALHDPAMAHEEVSVGALIVARALTGVARRALDALRGTREGDGREPTALVANRLRALKHQAMIDRDLGLLRAAEGGLSAIVAGQGDIGDPDQAGTLVALSNLHITAGNLVAAEAAADAAVAAAERAYFPSLLLRFCVEGGLLSPAADTGDLMSLMATASGQDRLQELKKAYGCFYTREADFAGDYRTFALEHFGHLTEQVIDLTLAPNDFAAQEAMRQASIQRFVQVLGGDHPKTLEHAAVAENNLGVGRRDAGHHELAAQHFGLAHQLAERALSLSLCSGLACDLGEGHVALFAERRDAARQQAGSLPTS